MQKNNTTLERDGLCSAFKWLRLIPSRAGNTYTVSKIPKAAQWRVELDKLTKITMYPNSWLGLNSLLARNTQRFLRLILELSSLGLHLEV